MVKKLCRQLSEIRSEKRTEKNKSHYITINSLRFKNLATSLVVSIVQPCSQKGSLFFFLSFFCFSELVFHGLNIKQNKLLVGQGRRRIGKPFSLVLLPEPAKKLEKNDLGKNLCKSEAEYFLDLLQQFF